jgi:molecular chaperone Hsp33
MFKRAFSPGVLPDVIADDLVQPFQIDPFALRGRLVRLGPLLDEILSRHAYPEPAARMLGEAITLAVALAGALKYDGVFTLQTKGDGPIRMMVADVTTAGAVRGYAQVDAAKLGTALSGGQSVPRLLGAGYLALTVDQGEHTERYQGIVELQGPTLAHCVHHYFRQSEQVEAALKVAVARLADPDGVERWRGGCLMIQRLPADRATDDREAEDEGWRRAAILMSSSTSRELVDPLLAPDALLFRLFHEDGVRVHAPHALAARCRCSRQRVETVLRALTPTETEEMKVDGRIEVTCEFCGRVYAFDDDALAALGMIEESRG